MANVTLSISEELYRRMKQHPEVKWSEIARRALSDYLSNIESSAGDTVPASQLKRQLKEAGVDIERIPLEKAVKGYERARRIEWRQFSMTQAA